jgi:cytochrome c553
MARIAAGVAGLAMALMGLAQAPVHEKGLDARLRAMTTAIIHAKLADARLDAEWLSTRQEVSAQLAKPAAAVGAASEIAGAATALASLAAACGSCHHAAGVTPATEDRPPATPGHIVTHMRAHQDAADLLLAGLVAPDGDAWVRGARLLATAPLRSGEFPTSTRIGALMAGIESRLHSQAATAITATGATRVEQYAAIVATCSQCHARHTSLWGRD